MSDPSMTGRNLQFSRLFTADTIAPKDEERRQDIVSAGERDSQPTAKVTLVKHGSYTSDVGTGSVPMLCAI